MKRLLQIIRRIQIKYFVSRILYELDRDYDLDLNFYKKQKWPSDDYKRSYTQYCRQIRPVSNVMIFILNFVSSIICPFWLFYCLVKRRGVLQVQPKGICFFMCDNAPSVYPLELLDSGLCVFEEMTIYNPNLDRKDLKYILSFWRRYPLSYWLLLRLITKLAVYRSLIQRYDPKMIVVTGENIALSSILTYYCEGHGIEHVDIMQGDMFSSINNAFFRYHKCFVWDEHYIDAFRRFGGEAEFIICHPKVLCINSNQNEQYDLIVDYTYYLSCHTEEEYQAIANILRKIIRLGKSVRVRPHFRWTNMDMLKKYFLGIQIEDLNKMTIEKSIVTTKVAVSLCSTVLLQVYFNGGIVMIDDIVYEEKYIKMKKLDYILLSKKHYLLSDVFREDKLLCI